MKFLRGQNEKRNFNWGTTGRNFVDFAGATKSSRKNAKNTKMTFALLNRHFKAINYHASCKRPPQWPFETFTSPPPPEWNFYGPKSFNSFVLWHQRLVTALLSSSRCLFSFLWRSATTSRPWCSRSLHHHQRRQLEYLGLKPTRIA